MDRTNYSLLAIVAAVALTAIVAMYVHAQRSPSSSVGPMITLTDGYSGSDVSAGITGNVVREDELMLAPRSPERARPDLAWEQYDYSADGSLTAEDTVILQEVVNRARFCPVGKDCDTNADGIIDSMDIRSFKTALVRIELENDAVYAALVPIPIAPATSEDDFWLAATGAVIS